MKSTYFSAEHTRPPAHMEKSMPREVQEAPPSPPPPYTAEPPDLPRFSQLSLSQQPDSSPNTLQRDQQTDSSTSTLQRELQLEPSTSTSQREQPSNGGRSSLLPCAIPQVSKAWRGAFYSPFVRAYPPELADKGINQDEFLTFIDGLNEAFVASPVFQVTNIAGIIMQQAYGVQPVQLAGVGLSVASGLSSAATSYARARAYVKAVNRDLFRPAGLNATVLKTKKMAAKVGYPNEKLELLPIDWDKDSSDEDSSKSRKKDKDRSKKDKDNPSNDLVKEVSQRRLDVLSGYVAPLNFDVPSSVPSGNLLKRMGENQAKRMERRQQKRMSKQRRKGHKEYRKGLKKVDKERRKMESEITKLQENLEMQQTKAERELSKGKAVEDPKEREKIEKNFEKEKQKIEKEVAKVESEYAKKEEKELKDGGKDRAKVDKQENKAANKLYWIVITKWDEESEESDSEDASEEDDTPETSDKSPTP